MRLVVAVVTAAAIVASSIGSNPPLAQPGEIAGTDHSGCIELIVDVQQPGFVRTHAVRVC